MDIAELDVEDATQTEDLFRLQQAVHATDQPDGPPPLREQFLASLREVNREIRMERLIARIDGTLAGTATLALPQIDNRHLAQFELQVHPAYRRRGVGRALLERVIQRARDEGRRALGGWTTRTVPGGPPRNEAGGPFLATRGFTAALGGFMRRIDLTAIDGTAEQRLLDECLPHAADYEWVGWTGLTPDELAGGVARLWNRMNIDAPSGDVELEAATMDAERVRARQRLSLDRGSHLVGAAARHRGSGEVAAVTMIEVRSAGDHGSVWATIADPAHRGHRLGTIVKIECHRLVRQAFPKLRYVDTGNADSNAPMVAINERLGFVLHEAGTLYQLTLEPPDRPPVATGAATPP
jgi:GNAT superfamily N-acetyltransferase